MFKNDTSLIFFSACIYSINSVISIYLLAICIELCFYSTKDLPNPADCTAYVSNGLASECAAIHCYFLCIIPITTVKNCS